MNYHELMSEPSNEDNFFLYEKFKKIDLNLSYLLRQTFIYKLNY